jgi:hypothetical protein
MLNPIILGDLSDVDVSEHENKAIQDGFIHLKVYVYLHKLYTNQKLTSWISPPHSHCEAVSEDNNPLPEGGCMCQYIVYKLMLKRTMNRDEPCFF